jgi:energy-coupling factor transport system substrate-specific component
MGFTDKFVEISIYGVLPFGGIIAILVVMHTPLILALKQFFMSAHSIVFAIGAIVWILGTIVFLLEIAGYTITSKGLAKNRMGIGDWSVIDIALVALSAAVYGGLLAATAPITIVPGFTWLRPANSLAPLFGMFFGIPGAVGVAIGNLLADILAGYFGVGSIGGFIGNFLIAYIPYKLVRSPPPLFEVIFLWSADAIPENWWDLVPEGHVSSLILLLEFYISCIIIQPLMSTLSICWWLDLMHSETKLSVNTVWADIAPTMLLSNVANGAASPAEFLTLGFLILAILRILYDSNLWPYSNILLAHKCRFGWNPLHAAVFYNHLNTIKSATPIWPYSNFWSMTPLHVASSYGLLNATKLLVDKVENAWWVNSEDDSGWTPLHYATFYGHLSVVKLLLDHGAKVNVGDKSGYTPLHWAASHGQIEIAKLLIKYGADVNSENNRGWTPLHMATFHGHVEVVKLLLESGAKPI